MLNPGSLAYPRQEGRKGSYMIMEIDQEERLISIRNTWIDGMSGRVKDGKLR